MTRLWVEQSETHTVNEGTVEEYEGTDVDGTLDIDGSLKLIDDADSPGIAIPDDPDGIDLPLGPLNFTNMQMGVALFLMGTISILGGLATVLKNYLAISVLMLAVVALVASGLLGIGLETFWALIMAVVLLIAGGAALRWF